MPTSNPDWSILASENERLADGRAAQAPPPIPKLSPAPRLRWRRRTAPGGAGAALAAAETTAAARRG